MHSFKDRDSFDEDLSHLEDSELRDSDRRHKGSSEVITNFPDPLFRIKIEHSSETLYATTPKPEALDGVKEVVITTRYGKDIGLVLGRVLSPGYIESDDVVKIDRAVTAEDTIKREANVIKEREAFLICKEKIEVHALSMKLVSAHYLLEEPKVLFFFTAETRVDFRELVKDLVSVFKMRIELRQIGVRDEARVLGGAGVCGRVYCCHSISDKLNAVSIKMAKDQNLSLNSMKISGPCGRLLCCLSYEYQFYRDERRNLPLEGSRFDYDGTSFRIFEINVLHGRIRLSGEDGRVLELPATRFKRNENGKWNIIDQPL